MLGMKYNFFFQDYLGALELFCKHSPYFRAGDQQSVTARPYVNELTIAVLSTVPTFTVPYNLVICRIETKLSELYAQDISS